MMQISSISGYDTYHVQVAAEDCIVLVSYGSPLSTISLQGIRESSLPLLPFSRTADELLQCQPYYCFYFSGYAFQSPMQNKEAELLLHSKKLHILFSITVQSPLWWRLGFKIFFSGCTSPVFCLHRSLDERNLSWHLMLVYSLPDDLLLHFLSSYHRWQALPPHSAIELWGILASFSCLSNVIWKYMLTKSKNTHRSNSNR